MDNKETPININFRFTFKPVQQSQRLLIHHWITQDHIKEWLHGDGLRNTIEDLDKFSEGTSWGWHWIAYDKDIPFAYLLTSEDGEDAITLDLFICDLNYLGKGLSVQMIQEFLISQFPNKKEVLIDPEATNARAIHVYEKVGFRIMDEFIAKWHPVPHYKMQLEMKKLMQNDFKNQQP
jgi:RimJ/RimL family protein N-acetyltransferase